MSPTANRPVRDVVMTGEKRLADLAPRLRRLVIGVIGVGAAVCAVSLPTVRIDRPALFVQMVALALLTSTVKLRLPLKNNVSTMSVSNALTFATMLLLGDASAVVTGVVSAWGQCTFRMRSRNPWYRTLFSMATVGTSVFAAALVFDWVIGNPILSSPVDPALVLASASVFDLLRAVTVSALVYFVVNSVLVASAVAFTAGQPVHRVWVESYLWSAPGYFVAALAGYGVVSAERLSHALGALLAVPLYLTYRSYRLFIARIEDERAQVRVLSDVQLATIEALALAIEVKDQTSQSHIQRFQIYAEGLAQAVHLEDDVRAIKTAALLHDIGNLAVPEHILGKPGTLTDDEFKRLQVHPRVGADIVGAVPFPYPVAPLILSHHEHWDGKGYPHGLVGEEIPIGARILTVVDFFTALLVDCPYRPARSFGDAIATLQEHAGDTLDPTLVSRFIDILPELEQRVREAHAATLSRRQLAGRAPGEAPSALEDIAGTHREAKALYEIAHALGSSLGLDDTFGLLTEKLRALVPCSACALFLTQPGDELLVCRRAQGTAESELLRMGPMRLEALSAATHGDPDAHPWPSAFLEGLVAPLAQGGQLIGAIAVLHAGSHRFGAEDRRLLHLVAQNAAPVVHNSLVFEQAQEASLTDPLTGLANRRALQKELASLCDPAPSRVGVLLLDLDGLKHLNDSFGHHVGDRAIREVGAVLRARQHRGDMCVRYAGDEFVVALRGKSLTEAVSEAKELQGAVANVGIDVGCGERVNLSISVGAAACPEDGIRRKRCWQRPTSACTETRCSARMPCAPSLVATPPNEPRVRPRTAPAGSRGDDARGRP